MTPILGQASVSRKHSLTQPGRNRLWLTMKGQIDTGDANLFRRRHRTQVPGLDAKQFESDPDFPFL